MQKAKQAVRKQAKELLKKKGVVGVGVGFKEKKGKLTKQISVICSVEKKLPFDQIAIQDLVPDEVEGIKTDVVETGKIVARATTDVHRPAPGGVSVGHYAITAGTLGCWVFNAAGQPVLLSNNHVLANSNNASVGDDITQPGPYDGGFAPAYTIAHLEDFVPITFQGDEPPGGGGDPCSVAGGIVSVLNTAAAMTGSRTRLSQYRIESPTSVGIPAAAYENLVDAAVATPIGPEVIDYKILGGIGKPVGVGSANLGDLVQKYGRTTQYSSGVVMQVDATVDVQYGEGKIARFTDQVITYAKSAGGDSGSSFLDMKGNLVGLLYAGSTTITIFNRIEHVFDALKLTL